MRAIRPLVVGLAITTLLISLTGCVSSKPETPDHKAKTTACLIRSATQIPGTPEKQLAADLVEAQVLYGLAVREVEIPSGVTNISTRLLTALQSGCVLMVSADTDYLNDLATFARLHSKMMVLFFGGTIASVDQPANFRWVADDALSGAKLAGFAAAGKTTDEKVRLFIQPSYFQAKEIETAFRDGVAYYNRIANARVALVVHKTATAKDLSDVVSKIDASSVIAIFAGKSVWQGLTSFESTGPIVFASDIQFGDTQTARDSRVIASVERDTSLPVLRAVSSLLDRKVSSDPKYRVSQTLKLNLIVLRTLDAGVFDGALTERLASYKQALISAKSN
jgi:basic membrane lipoprotein Med (substrate-binding protein (PBP1-ABC) superfamily)